MGSSLVCWPTLLLCSVLLGTNPGTPGTGTRPGPATTQDTPALKGAAGSTSQTGQPPQPAPVPVWPRRQAGETFYQLLEVQQAGAYTTQGITLTSSVRYSILSRFTIKKKLPDGKLIVEQQIEEVGLQGASPLAAGPVAKGLKDLQGSTFAMTLSPSGEVKRFQGKPGQAAFNPLALDVGNGFQMTSLLDEDGWKELIQATFFQPDESLFQGKTAERKLSHNWGPLGRWSGKVAYLPAVQGTDAQNVYRINYLLQMQYHPPEKAGGQMPLTILQAAFQPQAAAGQLYFDRDKGKVVLAQEQFRVTGGLTFRLGGQPLTVLVEETQTFRVQVFDRRPWPGK